jgi:hypothetical protein
MTQLAQEWLHGETRPQIATTPGGGLRPGLVFVPCPLCNSPVDLALLGDGEDFEPCARHRPVLTCIHGSRTTAEV